MSERVSGRFSRLLMAQQHN